MKSYEFYLTTITTYQQNKTKNFPIFIYPMENDCIYNMMRIHKNAPISPLQQHHVIIQMHFTVFYYYWIKISNSIRNQPTVDPNSSAKRIIQLNHHCRPIKNQKPMIC